MTSPKQILLAAGCLEEDAEIAASALNKHHDWKAAVVNMRGIDKEIWEVLSRLDGNFAEVLLFLWGKTIGLSMPVEDFVSRLERFNPDADVIYIDGDPISKSRFKAQFPS